MATPVNAPLTTTSLLVNTRAAPKIVYLPAASTVGAGKLYFIKDMCGNAAVSSIFISTTGLDTFDNRFRPSTINALMSTNFQSVLLASDGVLNWLILQNYNTNVVSRATNAVLPNLANLIVDLRGPSFSGGGSTWTNSIDSSTWTINTTYDAIYGGPLFNGSSSFAYRSSITNWSGSTFTVICYYYKSSTATGNVIFQMNRSGNINNEAIFYENSYFDYNDSLGYGLNFGTTTTINSIGLVMSSFVKNGATGTFYINGSPNGTSTAANNITVGNADFAIGKDYRDNSLFLAGTIKRFLIYNIALSASDIATVYSVLSSS